MLGIDETRRGKPRWQRCSDTQRWVRVDPWDTGFVDLAGDQGLFGQREGRTGAAVIDWLRERSDAFRDGVEYVAIDPAAVYATAIRTPGLLPNATLVVDHFHLVKLGQRRADEGAPPRHLGPAGPPRPQDRPGVGQPAPTAAGTGTLVGQEFREDVERHRAEDDDRPDPVGVDRQRRTAHPAVHRAHRRRPTPDPAPAAPLPVLVHRLPDPRTAHPGHHHRHLVARNQRLHRQTGITNARTEGYNRLVKQVKRVGCGFRNPDNSARRIRFHCTRKQRAATQTSC